MNWSSTCLTNEARFAGAVVVLLESIDSGTERENAREIWDVLQRDLELPDR